MADDALALALEERRRQALLSGDLPALQGLLADSLVYVHSTGATDSKASYLAKLASGSLKYLSVDFNGMQTQCLQRAVVVTGRMSAVVCKEGQEKTVASMFQTVWACDPNGLWHLHAHQGTPLPAP